MNRTIQSVVLGNDVTLECSEQGDPTGIPVICLHGITDSFRSFDRVVPHLPPSFRTFALSLRGHGHSSRPLAGYRAADFADDVFRFMNVLQLPGAILIGHSMGSLAAQRFAIDHPSRTLGLVLVSAFPTLLGHIGLQEMWDSSLHDLTDPVDEQLVRDFQQSTLEQPVPPAFFEMVVEESLKVPAHVWRAAFGALLQSDFSPEISRIQAPTLMLWGDRDAFCGASDMATLQRALPHARTQIYTGVGHAPHWEVPGRFAHDVVSFAQEACLDHAI